jgi:glycosyltransferase involved in cell wall biosynthesis
VGEKKLKIPFFSHRFSILLWLIDRRFLLSNWARGLYTSIQVVLYKPTHFVLMETQEAGYIYLRLARVLKSVRSAQKLLVLFGSDLYWYSKLPSHEKKIRSLLDQVDSLACEGRRDQHIARSLGFRGSFFSDKPVSGGPVFQEANPLDHQPTILRRTIAIKGYSNKFGAGEVALEALRNVLTPEDKRFDIEIFSAEGKTLAKARQLQREGYRVKIHKKFALSQEEVLRLLAKSRVYIGISRSDGLPASFMEALSLGTFPIQTSTSMAEDWVQDGFSGFLVAVDDTRRLEICIRTALSDDNLVHHAAIANKQIMGSNGNPHQFRKKLQLELNSFLTAKAID